MFQRLYELSQCLPPREPWERLNEGMPENYDRGLAICFDDRGQWTGVETYIGNNHVIYRSGPPNGTDFTPCCKRAKDTPRRLGAAVRNLLSHTGLAVDKKAWLAASLAAYEANRDTIWEAVEGKSRGAGVDGKTHRGYVYWAHTVYEPVRLSKPREHWYPDPRRVGFDPTLHGGVFAMRTTQQFIITLPNEMAEAVKAKVASGEYATETEVIRDGLRALLARDSELEQWLRTEVAAAYDLMKTAPSRGLSAGEVRAALAEEQERVASAR